MSNHLLNSPPLDSIKIHDKMNWTKQKPNLEQEGKLYLRMPTVRHMLPPSEPKSALPTPCQPQRHHASQWQLRLTSTNPDQIPDGELKRS